MNRALTLDEQIFLNQFSQKIHTLAEMNQWFLSYNLADKKDILENLLNMVIQSHPTYEEIEESAKELKKSTSTPAIKLLNRNKPFYKFGFEICNLPEKELLIGFEILLLTFVKADTRRKRQEEPGKCQHWWHKDLSSEKYLEYLRKGDVF